MSTPVVTSSSSGIAHQGPSLFQPLKMRGVTLRNRIGVSPMCTYSAREGVAQDWHLIHYGARALGGAGVVLVEATAVTAEGRISPADLGLWDDGQIAALARIARGIADQGAAPGIQLAHAGRKAGHRPPHRGGDRLPEAEGGWSTIAPSPLAFSPGESAPRALDESGIQAVIQAFIAATQRALQAGFTVIELHAAHGYLLHQFLSPLTNQRSDRYGGSLQNRLRLVVEIAQRLRVIIPANLPFLVRISACDWVSGGWDLEQSLVLAQQLRQLGVDLIDVSTGGTVPDAVVPIKPGYQVPFAEAIRAQVSIPTSAVGLITEPAQAEKIIASGAADLVLLGRELLRDPHWPLHAAHALGHPVAWPAPYLRAAPPLG